MKIALIAALNRKRVIGKDGKLPWHISDDMKRFKRLTTGHAILMGRKTYASLGNPLPNRRNVVVTSQLIPGIETYRTTKEALAALSAEERIYIIGGGQLFAETLDIADELYLTIVDADVDGDTFFPPYEHLLGTHFKLKSREQGNGFSFDTYAR